MAVSLFRATFATLPHFERFETDSLTKQVKYVQISI